jgi:hypothetical protein
LVCIILLPGNGVFDVAKIGCNSNSRNICQGYAVRAVMCCPVSASGEAVIETVDWKARIREVDIVPIDLIIALYLIIQAAIGNDGEVIIRTQICIGGSRRNRTTGGRRMS